MIPHNQLRWRQPPRWRGFSHVVRNVAGLLLQVVDFYGLEGVGELKSEHLGIERQLGLE